VARSERKRVQGVEVGGGGWRSLYTRICNRRPVFHETIRNDRAGINHRGSLRGWIARIGSIRPRTPLVSLAASNSSASLFPLGRSTRREGVEAHRLFLFFLPSLLQAVDVRQSFFSCCARARRASQGFRIEFRALRRLRY